MSYETVTRNKKHATRAGFTLVEILIVTGVLGTIAVVASQFFFSILRGSTKTKLLTEAKQSGSYALGVMERMIHNAKSLDDDYQNSKITIVNPDNDTTTFECKEGFIASNSASLLSSLVKAESCAIFTVTEGSPGVSPDTIKINFTLIQASADASRPEEQVSINFETTVSLRNY